MIREILKMGDPRLLQLARPVDRFDTPELHALVADLFDTMRAANGAGLAAPQIGVDLQVVIFGFSSPALATAAPGSPPRPVDAVSVPETVLINPVLTPVTEDMDEGWEGCLSVPGMRGLVGRYSMIRYEGFDQYGNAIDRVAAGFHARVAQHECDHLIGKLYPMRMTDFTQFGFVDVLFPDRDPASDD